MCVSCFADLTTGLDNEHTLFCWFNNGTRFHISQFKAKYSFELQSHPNWQAPTDYMPDALITAPCLPFDSVCKISNVYSYLFITQGNCKWSCSSILNYLLSYIYISNKVYQYSAQCLEKHQPCMLKSIHNIYIHIYLFIA